MCIASIPGGFATPFQGSYATSILVAKSIFMLAISQIQAQNEHYLDFATSESCAQAHHRA